MEGLHAAQQLIDWFHRLPPDVQAWLVQAYWVAVPILVLIIVWRLMRQESVSESGRVKVDWFSPKTWPGRFLQLREESRAALPKRMLSFMQQLDSVSKFGDRLHELILGFLMMLMAVLMGVMWLISPLQGWWAGLLAFAAGYFAKRLLRAPQADRKFGTGRD